MFPQRGICFQQITWKNSMTPTLNHMVDSNKLIWELASWWFCFSRIGFSAIEHNVHWFLPVHVKLCCISTEKESTGSKDVLFCERLSAGLDEFKITFSKRSQKRPTNKIEAKTGLMGIRHVVFLLKYHMSEYGAVNQARWTYSNNTLSWPWHSESEWKPSS